MDLDALNSRIDEIVEELGKLPFDDPRRKELVEQHAILARTAAEAEKRDLERVNSYRQNDINEDRLRIDEERIKVDKANSRREMWGRIGSAALSVLGSIGLAVISFKGEWLSDLLRDRSIWDLAKSLRPRN